MANCMACSNDFESDSHQRIYCSNSCKNRAKYIRKRDGVSIWKELKRRCCNCGVNFKTAHTGKIYCSIKCRIRVNDLLVLTRRRVSRVIAPTHRPELIGAWGGPYTPEEIATLRADPHCVLPNRTLRAQWRKCAELGIPRDPSLHAKRYRSPKDAARWAANLTPEYRTAASRRKRFRRRVRENPEPYFDELRRLAGGHQHAEDLVVEGFAIVLRLAIPAAEAFKIAKAEVNRTSAQPFREQSFNPAIDYEARETGRQVARASDIRAARGEG